MQGSGKVSETKLIDLDQGIGWGRVRLSRVQRKRYLKEELSATKNAQAERMKPIRAKGSR